MRLSFLSGGLSQLNKLLELSFILQHIACLVNVLVLIYFANLFFFTVIDNTCCRVILMFYCNRTCITLEKSNRLQKQKFWSHQRCYPRISSVSNIGAREQMRRWAIQSKCGWLNTISLRGIALLRRIESPQKNSCYTFNSSAFRQHKFSQPLLLWT